MFGFGRKGLDKSGQAPSATTPEDLRGPLFNALHYIGFVSTPGQGDGDEAIVSRAHSPSVCFGPENVIGRSFLVDFEGGQTGKAYLFPRFGSVWIDGEAGPRAQIPTEMIANRVPGYIEAFDAFVKQH